MTPKAFKHWRKSLQLSQKEAAAALGLKHRIVQYYEKGERDGQTDPDPQIRETGVLGHQPGSHRLQWGQRRRIPNTPPPLCALVRAS